MENANYVERFAAGIVDYLIVGFVSTIGFIPCLIMLVAILGQGSFAQEGSYGSVGPGFLGVLLIMFLALAMIVWSILVGVYFYVIIPDKKNGQTIGKSFFGLKVIRLDGSALTRKTLFIRYLVMWLTLQVLSILVYITIFFDEDQRTIYDMIAGTKVVKA